MHVFVGCYIPPIFKKLAKISVKCLRESQFYKTCYDSLHWPHTQRAGSWVKEKHKEYCFAGVISVCLDTLEWSFLIFLLSFFFPSGYLATLREDRQQCHSEKMNKQLQKCQTDTSCKNQQWAKKTSSRDILGKLCFFPLTHHITTCFRRQALVLCLSLSALSGCRHTATIFAIISECMIP